MIRPQCILVYKLHDRVELVELVLERSSRQHHGIVAVDAPRGLGYLCVPVFETLHLVHYQHVGMKVAKGLDIICEGMV